MIFFQLKADHAQTGHTDTFLAPVIFTDTIENITTPTSRVVTIGLLLITQHPARHQLTCNTKKMIFVAVTLILTLTCDTKMYPPTENGRYRSRLSKVRAIYNRQTVKQICDRKHCHEAFAAGKNEFLQQSTAVKYKTCRQSLGAAHTHKLKQ